jgi:hypothetical protein
MRSIKLFIPVVCLLAIGLFAFVDKKPAKNSDKGFAVVELFTSEGCSSCPPADAVVAKVEKETTGQPIYILAFHVDYWNNSSWRDIFSSADYSQRQNQYARWFDLSSVYTPQIVVNGKKEFVGSEEGTLRNTIKTDLQIAPSAQITLSGVKTGEKSISLQYQTQGNTGQTVLLLALVQKSAQNKIGGGENGGRTLSHVQIVRELKSVPLKQSSGSETIGLPKGFDANQYELIAFLQNTANGNITAATRSTL